jgi:hypothetical protein
VHWPLTILRIAGVFLATCSLSARSSDFARDVWPILESHCLSCHGPEKQKSDYRLDQKDVALAGGERGEAAIVPGKPDESPLLRMVSGLDKDLFMPPRKSDAKALDAAQVAILREWIAAGALWPDSHSGRRVTQQERPWSLKPLVKPAVPVVSPHPIDAFIRAKLEQSGFEPSPEANKRTLIRRVYYDLVGLPPSAEDVDAFVADPDPTAYERLIDRLLASPQYGERWARHWLDVVHYGESHGYDKDKPRLNAWPYRDYVIRAFNEDKPYTQFVQEQIAGDMLFPDTVDGITALGFIAAGPWDFIGHAEVPETKIDGMIARHLDRDDMVSNTINTFCSITVHCAQCHDHKFDPVSQEDYYALQAVFAALDRADRPYFSDATLTKRYSELHEERHSLETKQEDLEAKARKAAGDALVSLDKRIEVAAKAVKGNAVPEFGFHSEISAQQDVEKWVQVDLGAAVEIDKIVLLPCYDDFGKIGAGFGFPVRFKVEVSNDPEFRKDVTLVWRRHDATFMQDFPNPGLVPFETGGAKGDFRARYVRVTVTKLAPRTNDYIFALAEMQVFDATGKNVAAGSAVTSRDSIEALPRWSRKNLVDGHAPAPPDQNVGDIVELKAKRAALLDAALSTEERAARRDAVTRLRKIATELATFPKPQSVYAGTVYHGSGQFSGTGPNGGKPRVIKLLARGDVKRPGKEIGPGALSAIGELASRFDLPANGGEGERRAALARWLADPHNGLTWRSIVNRVWQYHFGRGIVETPNDFGKMGAAPSHPELLDWLAVTFRDDLGGSLKQLHRLIVTSAVYRQSSTAQQPNAQQTDSENRLLWKQNRRRLEAEAIRDSILEVSGKLDRTPGGPSFQDFVMTHPEHSPHYEYQLADPDDPKIHRRSIYRFIARSQQQPWMATMDCADPSMLVDRRNQTITPLQALAQMNNQLTVAMAKHFAARVANAAPDLGNQIDAAYRFAFQRSPTAEERAALMDYARANGLPNACRVLLNLNEFVFID